MSSIYLRAIIDLIVEKGLGMEEITLDKIRDLYFSGTSLSDIAKTYKINKRKLASVAETLCFDMHTGSIKKVEILTGSNSFDTCDESVDVKQYKLTQAEIEQARKLRDEERSRKAHENRLNSPRNIAIRKLYLSGVSIEDIAKQVSLSASRVQYILYMMDLWEPQKRLKQYIDVSDFDIEDYYRECRSAEKVAEKFNIPARYVIKRLRDMGYRVASAESYSKLYANIDNICLDYLSGASIRALAVKYNTGWESIKSRLQEKGIYGKVVNKKSTPETIKNMYLNNMTVEDISGALGLGVNDVIKALEKTGVYRRK